MILFLDCDGVINNWQQALRQDDTVKSGATNTEDADLFAMKKNTDQWNMWNLKYILDELPDLKVVVSSAWRRRNSMPNFKRWFEHFGLPDRIVDKTPEYAGSGTSNRAKEVEEYLTDNEVTDKWAVLDDHRLPGLEDHPSFFRTDQLNGLTYRDAINIIVHFNPKWKPPVVLM